MVVSTAPGDAVFTRVNALPVLPRVVLLEQELGKKTKLICFKDDSESNLRDVHWAAFTEF